MLKILKSKKGEGYIDVVIIVFVVMLFISLTINVLPVFITKHQLNTFATELMREAEIVGKVGSETNVRANDLKEELGINPSVNWSRTGNIQLNEEFNLTLTMEENIGFFNFGSFPIQLKSKASGKSEVYWK